MNKATPQNKSNPHKIFYDFKIKNTKVKVSFAQNSNAPTIENALANIAIRKTG